jgi:NADH-quinone oxidoreductase subunit M
MTLPALLALPLAGGIAAAIAARRSAAASRWVALLAMAATLWLAASLWNEVGLGDLAAGRQGSPSFPLEYRAEWIPRLGIGFHLGLDGLSLLLVLLTAGLGVVAVACSWREIQESVGFFHLALLANLAAVIGAFLALDLFLFFLFWEAMLVPMALLIALWGHASGDRSPTYAAVKFFLFSQASGLLMLLALLGLVWQHHAATGVVTFDYLDLLGTPLAAGAARWLMLGFFVAFAVKLPAVPFHPWLPDAHSQAPTAGSVILAGVLLKMGGYGLLRFALPLFPEASRALAPAAMVLAVLGIFYGAFLALGQSDVKRFVAYTSVSHMGFVLLGIYGGTLLALQGSVVVMLAHGLSTGALFALCGLLYERLHTRDIACFGALGEALPRFATTFMFFSIASLGLPGLGNFVGEFLTLVGSFRRAPAAVVAAAAGLVLAAVYSLHLVQRSLHGVAVEREPLPDLDGRERAMLAALAAGLLLLGLYPQPALEAARAPLATIAAISQGIGGGLP